MNNICPSDQELEVFLEENPAHTRDAPGSSLLSHHIESCDRCRDRVKAISRDNVFMQLLADAQAEPDVVETEQPPPTPIAEGMAIPGYEILGELHRGGQGVVYRAIQQATKRTVALKVLLRGSFASVRQRQRFEREIDLAAGLQHPNIVTIHDSGVAPDGNLYFAMAYIDGAPLDKHVRQMRETDPASSDAVNQALVLFADICAGVHHAHQRGVIHRDLKPSNVVVDTDGRPLVLDFGLAKSIDPEQLAEATLQTMTGEFMGTLAYASPEQTKGDPTLIDVRTDVYSLGVILYQLLTGHMPYRIGRSMAEALKAITDADPTPPSAWLRQPPPDGDAAAYPPVRIDAELETITLTALAKEKDRRYQTADALRQDIDAYLRGEPIAAKKDDAWYVLKKKLRRHRVPVLVGSLILTLAVGGTLVTESLRRATEVADRAKKLADRYVARAALEEHLLYTSGAAQDVQARPGNASQVDNNASVAVNGIRQPSALNPHRNRTWAELLICDQLFERLFWRTADLELVPNQHLIEKITPSQDQRTHTVRLKPDLQWHDGIPFTADDIVFSWQQTISGPVGSSKRRSASRLQSVEAVDPRTVRFVHKGSGPTWRLSMNFELIPGHVYGARLEEDPSMRTIEYYRKLHRNPVGSGPFRLKDWANDRIILERWDGFGDAGQRPAVRNLVFHWIEDGEARVKALLGGKLDLCMLTNELYTTRIHDRDFKNVAEDARRPSSRYFAIQWNCGPNSVFNDRRVRQAMSHAIDLDHIKAAVTRNMAAACYGPWQLRSPFFNPEVKRLRHNPAIAGELLDAAGWRMGPDNKRYRLAAGEKVTDQSRPLGFQLAVDASSPEARHTARLCREHLQAVGVTCELLELPKEEYPLVKLEGRFDALLGSMAPAVDPDLDRRIFQTWEDKNYGKYSNNEVDRLFEEGGKLSDPTKRAACYQQIHALIYEDQPMTFLYHQPWLGAVSKRLRGVEFSVRGPFLFSPGTTNWWVPADL